MENCVTSEFLLKETSFQILAAAFEVHNILGSGFLENVYQKALTKELLSRGLQADEQKTITVSYKGEEVGLNNADIVVNEEIILELKAQESLAKIHEAQLLNYLRGTGLKLGFLLNFGKEKVEYKRMVV
ncbi:MAG: GxxExxY protein [Geobacteraceae bacterium]|nr:GxxExxY protein [Geobacteraceae bacterium]